MYNDKDAGQYNENVEKQRMLNALQSLGFRTDDQVAKLAWRVATNNATTVQAELDLFKEIANIIKVERRNK